MIWTIVCFGITLFVLKRYAFGPIQKAIDERRERIRQSLDEADRARDEARELLEEHRAADRPGARPRPRRSSPRPAGSPRRSAQRMREETEADRQRRLEETQQQIEAETAARARADPLARSPS